MKKLSSFLLIILFFNIELVAMDQKPFHHIYKDGKLLGDKLKQLETAWLSNNFKLADEKVDSILRN